MKLSWDIQKVKASFISQENKIEGTVFDDFKKDGTRRVKLKDLFRQTQMSRKDKKAKEKNTNIDRVR